MEIYCSICGVENNIEHDCLKQLMIEFKGLEIASFIAGSPTEEECIEMRRGLKPLVDKVDKLIVKRQLTAEKFHRLSGEAQEKRESLNMDLKAVTDLLMKKLDI